MIYPTRIPVPRLRAQQSALAQILPLAAAAAVILMFLFGFGPNSPYALFSAVVLIVGLALLWRPGEPPVLLLIFLAPWLQASVSIYHANWVGLKLDQYFFMSSSDIYGSTTLSLFGLLAMAMGMRLGAGAGHIKETLPAREMAFSQPLVRWFWLYIVGSVFAALALLSTWVIPGLSQVILAFANLKWAFYFMLAYAAFIRGASASPLFLGPLLLELAQGIGGFFADFRTVLIITFLAAAAARMRFSPRVLLVLGLLVSIAILMGITWTGVKVEYRKYVSGGSGQQEVTVSYEDRISKLTSLVEQLNTQSYAAATDAFIRRLAYVEIFGAVLNYVPAVARHENGAVMWDAISRPFMPRLFFPDKGVINDTAITNKYTGGFARGLEDGTSISIGYIGESYIDFGKYMMLAGLMGMGLLYGRLYRLLIAGRSFGGLLGMALSVALLSGVGWLDNSFTKVFGGVAVGLIAAFLLRKFLVPRVWPWLLSRPHV